MLYCCLTKALNSSIEYHPNGKFDCDADNFSGHEDNTLAVFTAGGVGGIMSWIFTYPQDVIKSRIQGDVYGSEKYKGIRHCVAESLKNEGPRMFVRGIGSTIIR